MKIKEIKNNIKWKRQRAKRGFSDYDVYEIDSWFLSIMPKMLDELIKHNKCYPSSFENEYYKDNNLSPITINDEQRKAMDEYCFSKWQKTLVEMKNAFLEADKSTCSYKNRYKAEEEKIDQYCKLNKEKALKMFAKYFDDLWY